MNRLNRLEDSARANGRKIPYLLWSDGNETPEQARERYQLETGIPLSPFDELVIVRWGSS